MTPHTLKTWSRTFSKPPQLVTGDRILNGLRSEILEYNDVVAWIKSYVDEHAHDTTFVAMANHECGGLTLGGINTDNSEDQWNPGPLAAGRHSSERLTLEWVAYDGDDREVKLRDLWKQYGIENPNATEIGEGLAWQHDENHLYDMAYLFGWGLSWRTMVKWGSNGHSAVGM